MVDYRIKNPFEESDFETHHILPKSLFPKYKKEEWNIIKTSLREHYLLHLILAKALDNKETWRAIYCMSNFEKYKLGISSKLYEKNKLKSKKYMSGVHHPNYNGYKLTTEGYKRKLKYLKGNKFALNSKHTDDFKQKQSKRYKGKSYEERFGKEKSLELKLQRSVRLKEFAKNRDYSGTKNPNCKKYKVEGVIFNLISDICEKYAISRPTVFSRLKSNNWPTWKKLEPISHS